MMDQELGRITRTRKQFKAGFREPLTWILANIARLNVRLIAAMDGPRMARNSAQLQTFGWHVIARKAAD